MIGSIELEKAVLITVEDSQLRQTLSEHLTAVGQLTITANSSLGALQYLAQYRFLVALIDFSLGGSLDLLRALRDCNPSIQTIVLATDDSTHSAGSVPHEQVYRYLSRSTPIEELQNVLDEALYASLIDEKEGAITTSNQGTAALVNCYATLQDIHNRLLQTLPSSLISQFAEGLRHELGNALTVIVLNMALATHYRTDPARFSRHMDSLGRGVLEIERIAHALRQFPKMSQEELVANATLLDLTKLVREAGSIAAANHADNRTELRFELPDRAETRGDPEQIRRALGNIIENAIEVASEITIRIYLDDSHWCIDVQDNGPGFSRLALKRGLEPGFTSKVTNGFVRGLGFGLFIANHLLKMHQGELHLSNLPQGGARVQVWLPSDSGH